MSRIGKIPVSIPSGVKASFNAGIVTIEGPRGKLDFRPGRGLSIVSQDNEIIVSKTGEVFPNVAADFGTARAVINNMIVGVTNGWKRSLELTGVGFNAKMNGQKLVLAVGFSHEVVLDIPQDVKCTINKTTIDLESSDREALGTFAAKIRKVQPPEPYLGKGIRFSEEKVRRKAGKTGKK